MEPLSSDQDYFAALGDDWVGEADAQLSVDVIETPTEIWIRSAVAGVRTEDLDIAITSDTVTIRGERQHGHEHTQDHTIHIQECYWGAFSRSVVLPCHIKPDEADAVLKNGILTIRLKKAEMSSTLPVVDLN